jgi:cytoskeletal protein CcmA (bactofilin family)
MAARGKTTGGTPPEAVISVIGSGMKITGHVETDGAVRIDGTIKGDVRAGKAVVIGKGGHVEGSIFTQDAVLSGRVSGSIVAESRLEVQATAVIMGDIQARRMVLEEGAGLQGQILVGENAASRAVSSSHSSHSSPSTTSGTGGGAPRDSGVQTARKSDQTSYPHNVESQAKSIRDKDLRTR